jgi:hypothetical protein
MKRLILCCDGTWNTADQQRNGSPCPTNVVKLAYRVAKHDAAGAPQVIFYDQGVGTGNYADRLTGGAFGDGLEDPARRPGWRAACVAPEERDAEARRLAETRRTATAGPANIFRPRADPLSVAKQGGAWGRRWRGAMQQRVDLDPATPTSSCCGCGGQTLVAGGAIRSDRLRSTSIRVDAVAVAVRFRRARC